MREIKFRAWDDENKKMYHEVSSFNIYKLMQFTGLKDKNGTPVYESDILLIPDTYIIPITEDGAGPEEECNHLVAVEFGNSSFGIQIPKDDDGMSPGWYSFERLEDEGRLDDLEVIGNIYENPELLRGSTS